MKTLARLAFASITVLVFSMNADSADAQSYRHIERSATRLQRQSRELYNEFSLQYRQSTHFRHLMSDAASIYNEARHIHNAVHRGGLNHLAQDLKDIDRAYHHLEGLVRHIERDARRGIGHVHGRTGHLKRMMRQMKDTIHHLREDVEEVLDRRRHEFHHDFGHGRGFGRRSRGHGGHGIGISIRRGGVRVRIGGH